MNTRRLRPKWTLGTMLLVVGWSSVVVWLNVRPRVVGDHAPLLGGEAIISTVEYGYPWTYAIDIGLVSDPPSLFGADEALMCGNWGCRLAGNIAIGFLAVFVLTFASKYLLRRFTAVLRTLFGKPPPADVDGD